MSEIDERRRLIEKIRARLWEQSVEVVLDINTSSVDGQPLTKLTVRKERILSMEAVDFILDEEAEPYRATPHNA